MKKNIYTLSLLLLSISIFAQTPQAFKYQTIIRNAVGELVVNQNVGIQLSILEGSDAGTPVYTENWNVNTNQFGLVSLNVGKGTPTLGTFASINWSSNSYYLQVAADVSGGETYTVMGASQLLSVPYALYSNESANGSSQWINNASTIYYNGGNVGVGTDTPSGKLVIKADPGAAPDSTLFEVKDKDGIPIMRVTSEGVKIYVKDGAKGVAGGFAVGRYATAKAGTDTTFLLVTPDSTRVYTSPGTKGVAGGFAVGRYATAKGGVANKYFYTGIDSTRIYLKENTKGIAGGFAVGRYATAKGGGVDYFNINPSSIPDTINPSEPRILWYPAKEAFLTGRVLIESPDSVGLNSMATGFESKAIGNYSQAMGYKTVAKGLNSMAIGYKSRANGINSYAFGKNVIANDSNCFVFGNKSAAIGKGSFVFGSQDTAVGQGSLALGFQTKSLGLASFTMGAYTTAVDTLDVAMGYNTIASGGGSTAMGWNCQSRGGASLAMGDSTVAIGDAAISMGHHTVALGEFSTAMGMEAIASGNNSTAMGNQTEASGEASTSMGYLTEAIGGNSIAMGDRSVAFGDASFAMGSETHANGLFSVSIGHNTTADADASIAFGESTLAEGNASWAAGSSTHASGEASIALGFNTFAEGNASFTSGSGTHAKGEASLAFGSDSYAEGEATMAMGVGTHAVAGACMVMGGYNEPYSTLNSYDLNSYLFVIGNGTPAAGIFPEIRHNAVTVLKSGNFGINTNSPDKVLTVDGDARITGNIYYGAIGSGTTYSKPDFVFEPEYKKDFKISEIEQFIKVNKHLPWVTSAKDEKDGINMTRLSFETLEAIENQQLQIIKLNKVINEKDATINNLKKQLKNMDGRLKKIESALKSK